MAQSASCVPRLYKSVMEEVMANVRDAFLDEGIDEQVLLEFKQAWEQKVAATRATDHHDSLAASGQHTASSGQQQQQLQQTAHQQVASGLAGQGGASGATPAPAPLPQPQVNLVPVQITVPAQQAGGTAKTITIHVPSTALANGVAGAQLQTILSAPSAAQTFAMEALQAAEVIQGQLNAALQSRGITLPPQLLQFGSGGAPTLHQVDGAVDGLHSYAGGCSCAVHSKQGKRSTSKKSGLKKRTRHVSSAVEPVNDGDTSGHQSTTTPRLPPPSVANSGGEAEGGRLQPTLSVDRRVMDALLTDSLASLQVDGPIDDSSDEMSDNDDDDDDEKDEDDDKDKKYAEEEEEEEDAADVNEDPLNSADDVSDDDTGEAFETANVVVCQYDKITRVRNKWKFNLKDGIMNLRGKDYVFLKATGEGEW